jgi:hypothetical protein
MSNDLRRLEGVARTIDDELRDRLELVLDERDEIAFATAMQKAAMAGYREGVRAAEFAGRRAGLNITVELHDAANGRDLWAERYGHNDGGDDEL